MADRATTKEIERLQDDVARLSRLLKKQATDKLSDVKDEVSDRAHDYWDSASEAMGEGWDDVKGRAKVAGKQADQYVHENPWQVVGMAAAVGFVAALLLSAGKRDR